MTPAESKDVRPPRRGGRWALGSALLLAVLLGAVLAWRQWGRAPAPEPPAVPSTATDPQVARAVADARAAVLGRPRSGAAWGAYGMVLAAHGSPAEALACFAEAERLQPDEVRWPYYAGVLLLTSDPDRAVGELRRAVALGGRDNAATRLRLAEALLGQGRWDEAEELFGQVLAADSQNARAHLGLAQVAHEQGRAGRCRAELRHCLGSPYTRKTARTLLAQIDAARHDPAADREAHAAADLPDDLSWPDPYDEELNELRVGISALVDRARRLHQQGQPGEALALLRRAVHEYPDVAFAWVAYGKALAEDGDAAAAEEALRRAVAQAPRMAEAQFNLGVVLYGKKDYAAAAEAFGRAAASQPGDAQAHYNRGLCLQELGRRAEAIEAFRAAVRCKPDAAGPRRRLGALLAAEGHTEEAAAQLREALVLDPDDAEARRLLEGLRPKSPPPRPKAPSP